MILLVKMPERHFDHRKAVFSKQNNLICSF
jgi:hypothetical protein